MKPQLQTELSGFRVHWRGILTVQAISSPALPVFPAILSCPFAAARRRDLRSQPVFLDWLLLLLEGKRLWLEPGTVCPAHRFLQCCAWAG